RRAASRMVSSAAETVESVEFWSGGPIDQRPAGLSGLQVRGRLAFACDLGDLRDVTLGVVAVVGAGDLGDSRALVTTSDLGDLRDVTLGVLTLAGNLCDPRNALALGILVSLCDLRNVAFGVTLAGNLRNTRNALALGFLVRHFLCLLTLTGYSFLSVWGAELMCGAYDQPASHRSESATRVMST